MPFDLKILGDKLTRYREQFQMTLNEVATGTGIEVESLLLYEKGLNEPTGDEILILADFYKCDYKFFISNEKLAPFEQTETLFRRFGDHFSKADRWVVQEFLFLADCEAFLEKELGKQPVSVFTFNKTGNFYKAHAEGAAASLRKFFNYSKREVRMNIYQDFRDLGIHVFRRKLKNSNISGLFVMHPIAGKCILVNYHEDVYRQRFTASHEAGHAILDDDQEFVVSFETDKADLVEVRANTFASKYLMPPEFLEAISESVEWDPKTALEWASKLKVSTEAFAYALKQSNLIGDEMVRMIKGVRVPKDQKHDPELPVDLPPRSRSRKEELLSRGLSSYYVGLCFRGYREKVVSASRLAEMLLMESDVQLRELAELYGETITYGN